MISIYLKKCSVTAVLFIIAGTLLLPGFAYAQENSISLSVTPTLFEMSAAPQQVWSSSVKAINNNKYPLTVYASAVNFAPQGETGQGKLLPVFEQMTEGKTLAEWIDVTDEPVVLAPGQSKQIPFTVRVPDDASPGGHFAAILVGTRPPSRGEAFQIKTSQIVTSLFFVRIAGDVIEDGVVREFRTTEKFLSKPNVDFEVRFENKGNVHIQPQGQILIKNMWGKERGLIPINHQTHFGNVLPDSVRKFEFTWRGEQDFSDIGRYTADLTLAYGTDNRKFATSRTFFWVVPVKSVATVLGVLLATILFTLWAVKAYVRRMLALEGYEPIVHKRASFKREGDIMIERRKKIEAPVRAGWGDLTSRLKNTSAFTDTIKALLNFVWSYRLFFGAVIAVIVIISLGWYFINSVLSDSRDYEVVIDNPDTDVTLSSEEILYEQQKVGASSESPVKKELLSNESSSSSNKFTLTIVNSSDTTGAGAAVRRELEADYVVSGLLSDFGESKERSVIIYHKDLQEEALALRKKLGNFIMSALPPDDEDLKITIYIGNDYLSE